MITLTYLDDLSRVRVAVTGLPFDEGAVRIERSTNELYWQTVRGASELAVSGGSASIDDYEFTADVPNYYRAVPVDPLEGLHLNAVVDDYASTPDHASLDVTGDIDIRLDIEPDTWRPVDGAALARRYQITDDQRSWAMWLDEPGTMSFFWSPDGTFASAITRQSEPIPADSGRLAVRVTVDVDNGSGEHVVTWYTGEDIDGAGDVLGSPIVTTGVTAIHPGTAPLEVGRTQPGGLNIPPVSGRLRAFQVRDGIDGAPAADADFTGQASGTTAFTGDAGLPWTVHGDAYIAGTETASITPDLQGRVWFKNIKHPFLNRPINVGGVEADSSASSTGLYEVHGRSVPVATTDVRKSATFTLTVRTPTLEEARDMDLTIRSGGVFFVQPPAGSQIPGGYVALGDVGQQRYGPVATNRRWPLPCRIVAAPGPQVVGGTMTYGALLRLYGGYQNVLLANSTYADLLDLMADPSDLVVL